MGGGGNGSNGLSSDLLSSNYSDLKMQSLKMIEMVKDKCQRIKIGV